MKLSLCSGLPLNADEDTTMSTKHFSKGSATFHCHVCNRLTRDTQGTNVELCAECYEVAGIENELSDNCYNGTAAEAQKEIDVLNQRAVNKGGVIPGYTKEDKTMTSKKTSKKTPAKQFKKPATKKVASAKKASKAAKREINTDLSGRLHASTVESPVAVMWELCQSMKGAKRKDVIEAAQKKGIAFYTARTQYQLWLQAARNSK